MIRRGEGIFPSIKVADNVLIDIPSVDRGRGDPPHLIGVVVDEKDGKLCVAKHGFLDRWLERNCVQATSYSLLKVEDVTTDEEYSLRALVRLDSVGKGQGYQKCSCHQKCTSKRCACFKNSLGCNSACHPGRSCNNQSD